MAEKVGTCEGPFRSQDPPHVAPTPQVGFIFRRFQQTRCWKEGGISTQNLRCPEGQISVPMGWGNHLIQNRYAWALWKIIVLIFVTQDRAHNCHYEPCPFHTRKECYSVLIL